MAKNLHNKPFDEATILKLEIFEQYLQVWLPTFLYSPFEGNIQIWDFFAGQGYDMEGIEGSPIRILHVIAKFKEDIKRTNKKIQVIFNELDKRKYELLQSFVKDYLKQMEDLDAYVYIHIENKRFDVLFQEKENRLRAGNNLIFIDQNGVKEVSESVFAKLCKLRRTDFMFFISSSYFKRFGEEFKKLHPKLDIEKIAKTEYKKIHLQVHELFQIYAKESNQEMFLFPFSIQKKLEKGFNIYGLVFGAKHIAAAVKFLEIVWKKNPINGNADYDIEEERKSAGQVDLFTGEPKPTKVAKFQEDLETLILNKTLKTNIEVFLFTYKSGHVSEHAQKVVEKLKKGKKIHFNGSLRISYNAYKDNNIVDYEIL